MDLSKMNPHTVKLLVAQFKVQHNRTEKIGRQLCDDTLTFLDDILLFQQPNIEDQELKKLENDISRFKSLAKALQNNSAHFLSQISQIEKEVQKVQKIYLVPKMLRDLKIAAIKDLFGVQLSLSDPDFVKKFEDYCKKAKDRSNEQEDPYFEELFYHQLFNYIIYPEVPLSLKPLLQSDAADLLDQARKEDTYGGDYENIVENFFDHWEVQTFGTYKKRKYWENPYRPDE